MLFKHYSDILFSVWCVGMRRRHNTLKLSQSFESVCHFDGSQQLNLKWSEFSWQVAFVIVHLFYSTAVPKIVSCLKSGTYEPQTWNYSDYKHLQDHICGLVFRGIEHQQLQWERVTKTTMHLKKPQGVMPSLPLSFSLFVHLQPVSESFQVKGAAVISCTHFSQTESPS